MKNLPALIAVKVERVRACWDAWNTL